jgi:rhodanese-related sulfurtransferase
MKKILMSLIGVIFISGCTNPLVKQMNVAETKTFLNSNSDVLIIDVRTKEEYDLGHIEGAILIPYDQISTKLDELEGYKNKPILVYCRTKNRSSVAIDVLKENGFTNLYQMTDGYSLWNN